MSTAQCLVLVGIAEGLLPSRLHPAIAEPSGGDSGGLLGTQAEHCVPMKGMSAWLSAGA